MTTPLSDADRESVRNCFRNQLRTMIKAGEHPGTVLLVWIFSGDLPNSDLYEIYRTEAGEFIRDSGMGQGGSGSDPSIPPCKYCGAYGGGGHGGGCPLG